MAQGFAGSGQSISILGPAISAGAAAILAGTAVFSNSNGVSFGVNGSTVTASVAAGGGGGLGLSAGTQSVATGTVVFSNSNGLTFGFSGSSRVTGSHDGLRSISAGTTHALGPAVSFADGGGVSFGANGSTISASVAAGATATGNFGAVSAGSQLATAGTVLLSNSNGVSFGMSNSSLVTASHDGLRSISAGTTHAIGPALSFSNANGVSFGVDGQTVTASVAAGGGGGAGISAGTQSVSTGTVVFSNANGISFGMSGSSRVTASPYRATILQPFPPVVANALSQSALSFQTFAVEHPMDVTRLDLLGHMTCSSAAASAAITLSVAVYTFSGSTANMASSTSVGISWTSGSDTSASSRWGGQSGTRWRSVPINTWALTPGLYGFGFINSQNSSQTAATWTLYGHSSININPQPGGGDDNPYFGNGSYSANTTGFPATIHLTDIRQTGANALRQPSFRMICSF